MGYVTGINHSLVELYCSRQRNTDLNHQFKSCGWIFSPSNGFGMTWGRVNDDRILILWWTNSSTVFSW